MEALANQRKMRKLLLGIVLVLALLPIASAQAEDGLAPDTILLEELVDERTEVGAEQATQAVMTLTSEPVHIGEDALPDTATITALDAMDYGAGRIVFNAQELRDAIRLVDSSAWGQRTERVIYLGCANTNTTQAERDAVFNMAAIGNIGIEIPAYVRKLTIIGKDPRNGVQMKYTGWDRDRYDGTIYVAATDGQQVIWQDVVASASSSHGLTCGGARADVRVEFIRVKFNGVEMCHNEGPNTLTVFEDCNVTLETTAGRVSQKWTHCQDIIIRGGKTTVNKRDSSADTLTQQVFMFSGTSSCTLTIEENAQLEITSTQANVDFIDVQMTESTPSVYLKRNAKLLVNMPGRFSMRSLRMLGIAEGAELITNPNKESLANSGTYITADALVVDGKLTANYIYQNSTSQNDQCVHVQSMTVGPKGVVAVTQRGGIGSALYASNFSSSGEVSINYEPKDGAMAYSNAIYMGGGDLYIAPAGRLTVIHEGGRGTAIATKNLTCDGYMGVVYAPATTRMLSGVPANHALQVDGSLTVGQSGTLMIDHVPHRDGPACGGNTIHIPSNASTIHVEGTLDIMQTAGIDTIGVSAAYGTMTIEGAGTMLIQKEGVATGAVLKAGTININTQLAFTQKAGGHSIEAGTLHVTGKDRMLHVRKQGNATGSVFAGLSTGGSVLVDAEGGLWFEQAVGDTMLSKVTSFIAGAGSRVTLDRTIASATDPILAFASNNTSGNKLHFFQPDFVLIRSIGPMIGGGATSAGTVAADVSAINYEQGGSAHIWSANLAGATPTFTMLMVVENNRCTGYYTSLEAGNRGAAPGQQPLSLSTLNLTAPNFVFRTGAMAMTIDQPYKDDTVIRGTVKGGSQVKAHEYHMPQDAYVATGNESAWSAGPSYQLTLQRALGRQHPGRAYVQAKTGDALYGYGYAAIAGKVWIEVEDLVFEDTSISAQERVLRRKDPQWSVTVHDTRGSEQNGVWSAYPYKVQAEVRDLFRATQGTDALQASRMIFRRPSQSDAVLEPGVVATIHHAPQGMGAGAFSEVLGWDGDSGILFRQHGGEGMPETTYRTTMAWTMVLE